LDCGTGLHDPATRAALQTADQVLLVTDAEPSTASLVAEAARLISREGIPMWLVVNRSPATGSRLSLPALEAYVPDARGLTVIAADTRNAIRVSDGSFDWRDASAGWRVAARELAAVLVAAWPLPAAGRAEELDGRRRFTAVWASPWS
jgi:MinD-like ATPase involved in chromosome partitioning or flagellar assembly